MSDNGTENGSGNDEIEIIESTDRFLPTNLAEYRAAIAEHGGDEEKVDPATRRRVSHMLFSPERCQAIIDHIKNGAPNRTAAAAVGVHETTFYLWLKNGKAGKPGYQQFYVEVEQAQAEAELLRINRIADAGANGNWQADAWYLERRYPDRWAKKDRVDIGSEEPIKVKLSW
jgi:transposase